MTFYRDGLRIVFVGAMVSALHGLAFGQTLGSEQRAKLSYQECVNIGSDLSRVEGKIADLRPRIDDERNARRREQLQNELNGLLTEKRALEQRQLGCRGVTIDENPISQDRGGLPGGGSLPGGQSTGDAANAKLCEEKKPVLDRLRNTDLPRIQTNISTLQIQLNSKIRPPSAGERAGLEADLNRLRREEERTLTQIAIIKESLVSLGCDPGTGRVDTRIPDLLRDIERVPDGPTTPDPPSDPPPDPPSPPNPPDPPSPPRPPVDPPSPPRPPEPPGDPARSLCSRLPAAIHQVFDVENTDITSLTGELDEFHRTTCSLETETVPGRGRVSLTVWLERNDTAALVKLRSMRAGDDQRIGIGDEGYYFRANDNARIIFARGSFVAEVRGGPFPDSASRAQPEAAKVDAVLRTMQ